MTEVVGSQLRVLVVAVNASAKFGGEAILPLHYYRVLRRRGVSAWLLSHERTRAELEALFPGDGDRLIFVADTIWHRSLWWLGQYIAPRISSFTTGFALQLLTQWAQRKEIERLVRDAGVSIVHQPTPVSPKQPSFIFGVGVPVVIGPMNGGMDYPPKFRERQALIVGFSLSFGRILSGVLNRLIPGKKNAAVLLVANERTRSALPRGLCKQVDLLSENGVDLTVWREIPQMDRPTVEVVRFIFLGRLVDWKAVDLLLVAFKEAVSQAPMCLEIVGEGVERPALEQLSIDLGLLAYQREAGKVSFLGWRSQAQCAEILRQSHVLVLPSLLECGGAVVLEAMATGLPVIATNWGGPSEYLDSSCGILIEPESKSAMVESLTAALVRLARSPLERAEMGRAGRAKVVCQYDWEKKVDRILAIYQEAVGQSRSGFP